VSAEDALEPPVLVRGLATGFAQEIEIGPTRLTADEPAAVGGTGTGPTPYELLLAALGSCTSMTISMYARRKQFPLESVVVRLKHEKIHAKDCEECETKIGRIDQIEREIELIGPLTDEQREKCLAIAERCPVHQTLVSDVRITTRLR
jgi:putative redox protein